MFTTVEETAGGVAVAIIRDRKSKKFVWVENIAHPKPMLKLSGGTIEPGESAEEAIIREVRQETGLVVKEGDLLFLSEHRNERRNHSFYIYLAEVDGLGKLSREPVQDGDELISAKVLTLDEIQSSKKIIFIHRDMFSLGMEMMGGA